MSAKIRAIALSAGLAVLAGVGNGHCDQFSSYFQSSLDSKDPAVKIEYLTKAIAAWTPAEGLQNKAIVYINRGSAYAELKKYDKAIVDYDKAVESDPKNFDAYANRGDVYYALKRYDKVIADYRKVAELTPKYHGAYLNIGAAYEELGRYDKAIEAFETAVKLKPGQAEAYYGRGNCYYRLKQYDKAVTDYDRAIKLKPDYAEAYSNRANVYYDRKQYDKAVAAISKAIELKYYYPGIYTNRGIVYLELKKYDKAIPDFDRSIVIDPNDHFAYFNRGAAHGILKHQDKALADNNRAIELKPDHAEAYYNRGYTYLQLRQYDNTIADYNRALELKLDNPGLFTELGAIDLVRGKHKEAKEDFWKADAAFLAKIGRSPAEAVLYNGRGWNYLWLGKCEKGRADFDKALKLDKTDSTLYDNLGVYWWACRHDKAAALKWFEKSFQLGIERWGEHYQETSDGHFLKGLNNTPEFRALVKKYKTKNAGAATPRY